MRRGSVQDYTTSQCQSHTKSIYFAPSLVLYSELKSVHIDG
jgi:hypothetical protein